MMSSVGVDLILRRLAREGCVAQPVGTDAWQARCPIHGGPYPALLIMASDLHAVLPCSTRPGGTKCAKKGG
jgi:hypothetical protein